LSAALLLCSQSTTNITSTISSISTFPGFIPDWSNLNVLHRNTIPPWANFYNYASEVAALSFSKSEAEYESLNRDWHFNYAATPFEAPERNDEDPSTWDTIEVPGYWQRQGYGRPHHTNINYPFPVSPPNMSYQNPTGSYWRQFEVPEKRDGDDIRVRLEGVDSARNPSEFDITKYLTRGENNTLAAHVYQWSDGSYIEDQDQWWMSGIFRDVYLMPSQAAFTHDYQIIPHVADDFKSGLFSFNITTGTVDGTVSAKLLAPNGDELKTYEGPASGNITMQVSGNDFHLWSAETPTLYTVVLKASEHFISQKVGFHRVELSGPNMLINGKPIIIYGVNRHEHNADSGHTVPYEAMRADMIRMNQSNINTIRTAHQPHHSDFYNLADELGSYLIAEADLECHGFNDINDTVYGASQWTSINTSVEANQSLKVSGTSR
jgi:beta-galactosidase